MTYFSCIFYIFMVKTQFMLPDKTRKEWKQLVTGEKQFSLKNFVLQMKVAQTAKDIKKGRISVEEAVNDIYTLCKKYDKAVGKDVETIFNT